MANKLYEEDSVRAIANAVRSKGVSGSYKISEMAQAVLNIKQAIPIDVETSAEMDAALIADNVGKAYRFTGTTDDNYINGDIYIVEADS